MEGSSSGRENELVGLKKLGEIFSAVRQQTEKSLKSGWLSKEDAEFVRQELDEKNPGGYPEKEWQVGEKKVVIHPTQSAAEEIGLGYHKR